MPRRQESGADDKSSDGTSDSDSQSDASDSDLEEGEVASRRISRKNSDQKVTVKEEKDDDEMANGSDENQVSVGVGVKEEPNADGTSESAAVGEGKEELMEVTSNRQRESCDIPASKSSRDDDANMDDNDNGSAADSGESGSGASDSEAEGKEWSLYIRYPQYSQLEPMVQSRFFTTHNDSQSISGFLW